MELTTDTSAKFDLKVWMLNGKGYGPVEVRVDGKPVGTIGTGDAKPQFAHCALPDPLGLLNGKHVVSFENQAGRELVMTAVEITPLTPDCLKKWSIIGVFDTKGPMGDWKTIETVFPPEKELDLNAAYEGLGDKPIQWRQIDLGEDKFIQLLEKWLPYDYYHHTGVGYLAQWIYSPTERDVTFYYAQDWFAFAWLNGESVLDHVSGPWPQTSSRKLRLKAGWNSLLIKSSCGNTSWKGYYAFSDPGDMKFSATPPR